MDTPASDYPEVAARVFADEPVPDTPLQQIGHDLLGEFKKARDLRIDLENQIGRASCRERG